MRTCVRVLRRAPLPLGLLVPRRASHPIELAGRPRSRAGSALALTDHDGLHGAMELAQALKPLGIRPITGAEMTLDDGSHLTLLCETRAG